MPKKLSERDEYIILDALKITGKCDEAYWYMEENLHISNYRDIQSFMQYCDKYELPVGSATIQRWWKSFNKNPDEEPEGLEEFAYLKNL